MKINKFIFCLLLILPLRAHALEEFNLIKVRKLYDSGNGNVGINNEANAEIYQEILKAYQDNYQSVAEKEASQVLDSNQIDLIASLNSIGFSIKRPFAKFLLNANRSLAPDLFDDKRWIITDTLTLEIDASKFLSKLKDEKSIDISESNMALFAGLVFKRKFTYVHFANSYKEGLLKNYDKLFFPFAAFHPKNLKKLSTNEMVQKEDSLSFNAGAMVSAPLYQGLSGAVGILASYETIAKVEVARLEEDILNLSSKKNKVASIDLNAQVQADFFNLLKLTLFSYDFSYEYDSSYKISLNIPINDFNEMHESTAFYYELIQLIKGQSQKTDLLTPYLVSEEYSQNQKINQRYGFLLLGGQKEAKTQIVKIETPTTSKTFYKHYFESIKFTESLLSKLFTSVVKKYLQVDLSTYKISTETKKLQLEYHAEKNLLEKREKLNIGEESNYYEEFSLNFNHKYNAQKETSKTKEKAIFLVDHFSGVTSLALDLIRNDQLKVPYEIDGKHVISLDGIRYFNDQSIESQFENFEALCDERPRTIFSGLRSLFDLCTLKLNKNYISYYQDLSHDLVELDEIALCEKKAKKYTLIPFYKRKFLKNCLSKINVKEKEDWNEVPLWSLKELSNAIVKNNYDRVHMYNMFGVSNVFFYGSFKAKTLDDKDFITHFSEGEFKGLGAIDHYLRAEKVRAPASVIIEE